MDWRFFFDERNTLDHAFRFRCIVDTWGISMNFLSQFWVVPMNIWKLLLFSENSSKLVNEHVILHPKNWNRKSWKKIDANFSPKCSCLSSSVKDWQSPNNRRLGDADNPGFQRSWWFNLDPGGSKKSQVLLLEVSSIPRNPGFRGATVSLLFWKVNCDWWPQQLPF